MVCTVSVRLQFNEILIFLRSFRRLIPLDYDFLPFVYWELLQSLGHPSIFKQPLFVESILLQILIQHPFHRRRQSQNHSQI